MTELSSAGAALVRAARAALRPSPADRERIAAALRARLGDAARLPAPPTAWAKLAAVAAAVGLAGIAAFFAWNDDPTGASKPLPNAAAALAAPVITPAAAPTLDVPAAPVENLAQPEPSVATARRAQDHLAQEVAILSRATSELRAGRATSALDATSEHERRFPRGLLSEERRAARAQALCTLGRRGEAELELRRLERSAPQSPNTARAKQVCGAQTRR